jgi:hypothetical protein
MQRTLIGLFVLFASASIAHAQTFDCPQGMPASLYPGPAFVPSLDCQGWVPANHPLARRPVSTPAPPVAPPAIEERVVYAKIETPTAGGTFSASAGGISQIGGWALDCPLGTMPPVMRVVETKPDGSLREVPNDFQSVFPFGRPDIQAAFTVACPAVLNVPDSQGHSLGANDAFGWLLRLRSPVTEIGVHTFTATFAWPTQNHAGSTAISVIIVP